MGRLRVLTLVLSLGTIAHAQSGGTATPARAGSSSAQDDVDDDDAPEVEVVAALNSCPSAEVVADKLQRGLLTRYAVVVGASTNASIARIIDLGDSFDVSVGTHSRRFKDPYRHCDERALSAGVFIALQIEGPNLPEAEKPTAPAPPAPPPRPDDREGAPTAVASIPSHPSHPLNFQLSVAVTGGGAHDMSDAGGGGLGGGQVRFSLGWKHIALRIGGAVLVTSTLTFANAVPATWREVLLPFDLAVEARIPLGRWDGTLAAGPLLLVAYAPDLSERQVGAGAGLHADAAVRYWLTDRTAVFLAFEADWTPEPIPILNENGVGTASLSPYLLRGAIGACVRLR